MIADAILIVFISVCTALLSEGTYRVCYQLTTSSEGILYVLVYRTDNYKRLKTVVERQSKRCKPVVNTIPALCCSQL